MYQWRLPHFPLFSCYLIWLPDPHLPRACASGSFHLTRTYFPKPGIFFKMRKVSVQHPIFHRTSATIGERWIEDSLVGMGATAKRDHFQSHQWMSSWSLCLSYAVLVTSGTLQMNSDHTSPLQEKCHGVYVCTLTLSVSSFISFCFTFLKWFESVSFCSIFCLSVNKSRALFGWSERGIRGLGN